MPDSASRETSPFHEILPHCVSINWGRPRQEEKRAAAAEATTEQSSQQTELHQPRPQQDEVHITCAVAKGYIKERRAMYLGAGGQWTSTFVGAFRINPPESTEVPNFDRIVPFEFFLWSDVDPQPNFDYVKKMIAAAVEVKRSQFFFETMSGKKICAQSMVAEELETLIAAGEASELLNGKHLIDIRIVAKVREPMPSSSAASFKPCGFAQTHIAPQPAPLRSSPQGEVRQTQYDRRVWCSTFYDEQSVRCSTCEMSLNGNDMMEEHLIGKRHKKKVRKQAESSRLRFNAS